MSARRAVIAIVVAASWAHGFAAVPAAADDWPQWRGPQRDGVWRETGLIEEFESDQIPLKWSVEIGGGYSGPTVADGRVYVTDCVTKPREMERVHCFDAMTGERLWSHSYDVDYGEVRYQTGPRASVLIHDGLAYSLGTVGHLHCFDAASGELRWKRDLNAEYKIEMPNWGIAASPIIEGDVLIVHAGGDGACLIGFDRKTGREIWRSLPDRASYSPPIVIEQAGRRLVVCYTAERIAALDPQTGELQWDHSAPPEKWPIAISDPIPYRDLLLITEAHKGSILLRTPPNELTVEKVWEARARGSDSEYGLHTLISTPFIEGDYIYAADSGGTLRCIDLRDGRRVWEDTTVVPVDRFSTAHIVRQADRLWIFNERGELIIGRVSPSGFEEISRAKLIEPTADQFKSRRDGGVDRRRGGVVWTHPAYAYKHVFVRNDERLVCADLSAK